MCMPTGARTPSATAGCARPPTGSPMCCARTASRAATASRIMLPQAPEVAAAHIAIYKLGAVALPVAMLFGPDALAYRLQNSGAKALHHQRARPRQARRDARRGAGLLACCRSTVAVDGRQLRRSAGARVGRFHAGRHRGRRSGDDDLHLRHHRPAERRAARAIACCSAICPAPSCRIIRSRKPGDRYWTPADWAWAGGLLDVLLPSLHHGVPVVARRFDKFDPEEAFALMAAAQRAQRLHPADRAAHDARGAEPARPLRFQAAQRRLGRRVARRRGAGMGQGGVRPRPSTSSTARPNAIWCSAPARSSACCKPGAIGKPVPGHTVAVIGARRHAAASPARSARSR